MNWFRLRCVALAFASLGGSSAANSFEMDMGHTELGRHLGSTNFSELVVGDQAYAEMSSLCWQGGRLMIDASQNIGKRYEYSNVFLLTRDVGGKFSAKLIFGERSPDIAELLGRTKSEEELAEDEIEVRNGALKSFLSFRLCADLVERSFSPVNLMEISTVNGASNFSDLMKQLTEK